MRNPGHAVATRLWAIGLRVGALAIAYPGSAEPRRAQRELGEQLFSDINLSLNRNQSCETCHSLAKIEVPTETETETATALGVAARRLEATGSQGDTAIRLLC